MMMRLCASAYAGNGFFAQNTYHIEDNAQCRHVDPPFPYNIFSPLLPVIRYSEESASIPRIFAFSRLTRIDISTAELIIGSSDTIDTTFIRCIMLIHLPQLLIIHHSSSPHPRRA